MTNIKTKGSTKAVKYNRSCIPQQVASPEFQCSKQVARSQAHNLWALHTDAFNSDGNYKRVPREKEDQFPERCFVFLLVFKKENWVVLAYPPSEGAALISFASSQETEAAGWDTFSHEPDVHHTSGRACLQPSFVLPKRTSGKTTWTPAARVCRDLATRKPGACWGGWWTSKHFENTALPES